jgi:hypothetical protein
MSIEQYIINKKEMDISSFYQNIVANLRLVDVQVLHCVEEMGEVIRELISGRFDKAIIELVDVYGVYMLVIGDRFSQQSKIKPIVSMNINEYVINSMEINHKLISYIRRRLRLDITFDEMIMYTRKFISITLSIISDYLKVDYYRLQNMVKQMSLLQFIARPLNKAPNDTWFTYEEFQAQWKVTLKAGQFLTHTKILYLLDSEKFYVYKPDD